MTLEGTHVLSTPGHHRPRRRTDIATYRFERLVEAAVSGLPQAIHAFLDNVVFTVEDAPTAEQLANHSGPPDNTLFGLYEGTPRTERTSGYGMVLPDKITLFRKPLEEACPTKHDLIGEIRTTIVHEIAHHFGIDDDRLTELGWD